jgi:hypothetical protein
MQTGNAWKKIIRDRDIDRPLFGKSKSQYDYMYCDFDFAREILIL